MQSKKTFLFIKIIILMLLANFQMQATNLTTIVRSKPWLLRLFASKQPIKKQITLINPIDIVGQLPKEFFWIIDQLNNNYSQASMLNRIILYGPPGNGKSTLAQQIANLTESIFIPIKGPSICGPYAGQGPQTITELFERALEINAKTNNKVIIFIDEIDAIGANNKSEHRAQQSDALQVLWLYLDKIKYNTNFFVICATNNFEGLHQTFIDRFGTNIIEIKNPNFKTRTEILHHYFIKNSIACDIDLLHKLAKNTNNFSIRALEDLVNGIITQARMENDTVITEEIVWEQHTIMKKKYKIMSVKQSLEQTTFWQNTLNISGTITHSISILFTIYQIYHFFKIKNVPEPKIV